MLKTKQDESVERIVCDLCRCQLEEGETYFSLEGFGTFCEECVDTAVRSCKRFVGDVIDRLA